MTEESLYFKPEEFRCKCCGRVRIDPALLGRLDAARRLYGAPMHVVSGYRCPAHNEKVGGVSQSYHTHGKAADIKVADGADRYRLLKALLTAGFNRVGIYRQGFIHVDVGPAPVNVVWIE